MKNTDIKDVRFMNEGAAALYYGSTLVWKRQTEVQTPSGLLSGKFSNSTPTSWQYYLSGSTSNKVDISEFTDSSTKEFSLNLDSDITSLRHLFNTNTYLTNIYSVPVTENVTDLFDMFYNCYGLTSVDASNWDTRNVTNMSYLFYYCYQLKTLEGYENWDVRNVTNLNNAFYRCWALPNKMDLSNWSLDKIQTMNYVFQECNQLTTLELPKSVNGDLNALLGTFKSCSGLTSLDCSNWNTKGVTNYMETFGNCTSLVTLNISNWDFGGCTTDFNLLPFSNCSKLENLIGPVYNIKADLNVSSSPLTRDSAMVLINGLVDVGVKKTLSLKKSTFNELTEEEIAVATSKGWTITSY